MIDRTSAPQTSLPAQLNLPPQEDFTTPKGIKLYSINAKDSGVVRLTLVFQAGSRMQTLPYEALTAVAMLSEGTSSLDAAQIAERFDFYGIYYDTSVDRDFATITIACVSEFLDEALRLLGDMLSHPTFPERQIEIYTSRNERACFWTVKNLATSLVVHLPRRSSEPTTLTGVLPPKIEYWI